MGSFIKSVASRIRRCRDYLSWFDQFGLKPETDSETTSEHHEDLACGEGGEEDPPCLHRGVRPFARAESDEALGRPFGPLRCRVLVIDDDESIRYLLQKQLTKDGREVFVASNGREGLRLFYRDRPDITLLDLVMPGMSGLQVLRRIKSYDPHAVVMIFTGYATEDTIKEARSLGVTDFLQKGQSLPMAWDARRRPEVF